MGPWLFKMIEGCLNLIIFFVSYLTGFMVLPYFVLCLFEFDFFETLL
jgi:hypothetical protein